MADPTEPRPPIRFSLREALALLVVICVILGLGRSLPEPFHLILSAPLMGIAILVLVARWAAFEGLVIGGGTPFFVLLPLLYSRDPPDRILPILLMGTVCSWMALFGGCGSAAAKGYGPQALISLLAVIALTGVIAAAFG